MTPATEGSPAFEDIRSLALLNYGHFTSIRVDNQHARGLSLHFARLASDCQALFGVELDLDYVRDLARKAVADLPHGSCVMRLTVFDPALELGHPAGSGKPTIMVTTRPAGPWPPTPFRVRSIPFRREYAHIKHTGLFGAVASRRGAQLAGYDDALFTDTASRISEGATWNIGLFDGESVVWPAGEILPGVTMRLLQQAHPATISRGIFLEDIPTFEAAFATNTTVGVRPLSAIDEAEFPIDHPILDQLRREYETIPLERM